MSEPVSNKVYRAESSSADVAGNLKEAFYLIDNGRLADAAERLEWAKKNVSMLPFYIDEALAAARKELAEGGPL